MRSNLARLGAAMFVAVAVPAQAAWHEAKSKHFIIYADDNPKSLTAFATRLEQFDQAARALLQRQDPPVGDGNRVTIYVLPTDADVRKLAGETGGFLSGFYTGRVEGSLVYVPKRLSAGDQTSRDTVLYHEYSHHLMMQQLDQPYPEWYVEGFAEFLSTPVFNRDGSVGLGRVPQHRGWGLFNGQRLPIEALLGQTYGDITKLPTEQRESIYGRGWLLVHYLVMEPSRKGQLERYILRVSAGTSPLQAAQAAFGDLKRLDKDLEAYLNRSRVQYFIVGAGRVHPSPVDVRPLTPGGSEMILLRARLKNGVASSAREALAAEIRVIAQRYPQDELVQSTLAEAELDAEHAAAAEAAADRAIRSNPRNTEALVLKGRAIALRARDADADEREKLFNAARAQFLAANKVDTEDPEPLMQFYKTFVSEGVRPTDNALAALHYASDLAPQDLGLRVNSAIAYLNEGKLKEARRTLIPVAYSPHGGGAAAMAKRMIARIDGGADGRAVITDSASAGGTSGSR